MIDVVQVYQRDVYIGVHWGTLGYIISIVFMYPELEDIFIKEGIDDVLIVWLSTVVQ